jgi:hypothetical protein
MQWQSVCIAKLLPLSIDHVVQQPQVSSVTIQSQHLQTLTFSQSLNYEQLAVWLANHPQFMGADHQEDISKLKGIINYRYRIAGNFRGV